jgi:hypothetical protein
MMRQEGRSVYGTAVVSAAHSDLTPGRAPFAACTGAANCENLILKSAFRVVRRAILLTPLTTALPKNGVRVQEPCRRRAMKTRSSMVSAAHRREQGEDAHSLYLLSVRCKLQNLVIAPLKNRCASMMRQENRMNYGIPWFRWPTGM